jgi:hypothetical protein
MEQLKATAAAKPSQPTHNKALNDEQQIILQRNKAQQIWDATCSTVRSLITLLSVPVPLPVSLPVPFPFTITGLH